MPKAAIHDRTQEHRKVNTWRDWLRRGRPVLYRFKQGSKKVKIHERETGINENSTKGLATGQVMFIAETLVKAEG